MSVLTVDRVLPRYTVQSPAPHPRRAVCRINWIRRHVTFPSYRLRRKLHGRSATLQATPHATPWRRFDKTGQSTPVGRSPQAGKEMQELDLFRLQCHNVWIVRCLILHRLGPPVGDPAAMYVPPLRYKAEVLAAQDELSRTHTDTRWTLHQSRQDSLETKAIQHTVDVGYYAPAARTTLNQLCSSCSSSEIELVLANPRVLTLWA